MPVTFGYVMYLTLVRLSACLWLSPPSEDFAKPLPT